MRAILLYKFGLAYFKNSTTVVTKLKPSNGKEIECSSLCKAKFWDTAIKFGLLQVLTYVALLLVAYFTRYSLTV